MAAAPTPTKGGNVLTKKLGPLPGWAWVLAAVGGYYLYKKRQAAAAASTTGTTAATTSTAASTPTASGYSGPGTSGGEYGYQVPTGAVASTASAYAAPTGETLTSGGGYQSVNGAAVTDAQGNVYTPVQSGQQAGLITGGGGTLYSQPQPGVFSPLPNNQLIPNVAAYSMTTAGSSG